MHLSWGFRDWFDVLELSWECFILPSYKTRLKKKKLYWSGAFDLFENIYKVFSILRISEPIDWGLLQVPEKVWYCWMESKVKNVYQIALAVRHVSIICMMTRACGRQAAFLYHNDQSSEIDDIVVRKMRQKKLMKQPSWMFKSIDHFDLVIQL